MLPTGERLDVYALFFPIAYDNKFRLIKYVDLIWQILSDAAKPLRTGTVPMEHLTRTIEYLLLANRNQDSQDFSLSAANIKEAVTASNIFEFCGLLS